MNPTISIATSLYPAAKPYLKDLLQSLDAASEGHDFSLILTLEGDVAWEELLKGVQKTIHSRELPEGLSVGEVRQNLFELARIHGGDAVIFVDADDMLLPGAVTHYLEGLERFDFVCGNIKLSDERGEILAIPPLYDLWQVPRVLDDQDILIDGNIIGLGAVAIRQDCLSKFPFGIPSALMAVDWWIFTNLLEAGCRGRMMEEATLLYRQHNNNVSGIFPTRDPELLKRRATIAVRHFQSLPATLERQRRLDGLLQLIQRLGEPDFGKYLNLFENKPIPWYSDVIQLALKCTKE